jgi:hypothetical protein
MSKKDLSLSDQLTKKRSYLGSVCTFLFRRRESNSSRISSISDTTSNSDTTDFCYDITEEEEFSLIDSLQTMPLPRLLQFLQGQPLTANQTAYEFEFVTDKIKEICHCLDTERPSTQFANTSGAIGSNLVLAAKHMVHRYHDDTGDSWLALMGLLVIGLQVLETPSEVKKELVHTTKIGRVLILEMSKVLKFMKKQALCNSLRSAVAQVVINSCHQEERACLPLLKTFCQLMADYDSQWTFKQEYEEVVSMATTASF